MLKRDKAEAVLVAPGKHVLFMYTPKHDGKAVDALLGEYQGFLVVDAHSVYDHLFEEGVIEVACWAHYPEREIIWS